MYATRLSPGQSAASAAHLPEQMVIRFGERGAFQGCCLSVMSYFRPDVVQFLKFGGEDHMGTN